ncbi:shikimate kinase [Brachybacterium huguangmaarense]
MTAGPRPVAPPATGGPRAVLIGPMAAGKTSVGRRLAQLWGVPFTDLDREVEITAGLPVPEIFAREGEEAFRRREADALARLLVTHTGVLALGGGAPLTPRSAAALAQHAVVLLEIDEETATRRLRGGAGRPLLAGEDPLERWRTLAEARMPSYRALARCTVDGRGATTTEVAQMIADLLENDTHEEHP